MQPRIEIRPKSPLGAEVIGVEMQQPLSDGDKETLRAAFDKHALLLFRNQELQKSDLLRIAEVFGTVSDQGEAPGGMNLVSNLRPRGTDENGEVTLPTGDGELSFHFDHCFQEHPLRAIMLYGIEIPPQGGDTLFTDMRLVTRRMPAEIRSRIDGKVIRHKSFARTGQPEANHPIMYSHPRTGEPVLFFSKLHAREILEMPEEESKPLFDRFVSWIEEDATITYRHQWRPKDLVIWDNIALQHARETFDPKYKRHLQRVQIG